MSDPFSILLGVNIDHVATLRQSRGTTYPDPLQAALDAEQAGADGITLHLREDRRHIQEHDVERFKTTLQTRMNLEMAVTEEMLTIAAKYVPENCCLVPERREELTTEGGLDVASDVIRYTDACERLREAGIVVSLFIDSDKAQIDAAVKTGTPFIEIHTGHFADADSSQQAIELRKIREAVVYAHESGLQVNAGHGLHYENVQDIAVMPEIIELNIGHAIVARAVFVGMSQAVSEMKKQMLDARKRE